MENNLFLEVCGVSKIFPGSEHWTKSALISERVKCMLYAEKMEPEKAH